MRPLVIVLVLLNLLALASIRGWLGTPSTPGEPERLTNQLNPDRIKLRPPEPLTAGESPQPSAATPSPAPTGETAAVGTPAAANGMAGEPLTCFAYTGLTEKQADTLVTAVQAAYPELRIDRSTSSTPRAWWVQIPAMEGREGAQRRVEELRSQGVTDYFIVQEPGQNQFAISLGLFKTEAKAQQHLAFLLNKGVREASVTPRTATVHRVEFRGPAALVTPLERSRAAARVGALRSDCTP
jgi:hypothetical protein